MFETPSSTHGYVPVVAVFWVYVLLTLGITLALRALGMPGKWTLYVFVAVALLLVEAFVPLFSRYAPGTD
ncbi:hypothetical protein GJR96_03520 [Haloferax sp. MBLA0076]|uniref:Uncharacterized protein n=1 Tax=Haloferax litoreum TaxID=2666140 RepID=A0A6A8GD01_9EURY|nr:MULTISPECIES: hypothetical protein [Haloferax]KAB1192557.1 hypothetical protein Hfx1148_03515 [Haloferax sp. CBA1148]MRX21028.1 hypothetical protein [Haloferax litoreum]